MAAAKSARWHLDRSQALAVLVDQAAVLARCRVADVGTRPVGIKRGHIAILQCIPLIQHHRGNVVGYKYDPIE